MEVQNNGVYGVSGFIDYRDAQLYEYQNKLLRRRLLEGLEEVLFSPGKHVVEITRKTDQGRAVYNNMEHVSYRAKITQVQEIQLDIKARPYYPAKGRNHRKKDRARARQRRAMQRKLREHMKHE